MNRVFAVLRDPVAWILVVAGIVELISGGTAARGAILFAGAGLIVADRIRVGRARVRASLGSPSRMVSATAVAESPVSAAPLQAALERGRWIAVAIGIALLGALFGVHTLPLTALTGVVGILVVGWAWLSQPDGSVAVSPPLGGLLVWGGVLLALGLWELTALLGQPTLAEASYEHPTISYLLDPILGTFAGRAIGLALWAAAGRSLVRRS